MDFEVNLEHGLRISNRSPSLSRLPLLPKGAILGSLGGAAVWRLPLAQGAILETRDQVPRQAPGTSLLLALPVSLPLSLFLSLSIMNK